MLHNCGNREHESCIFVLTSAALVQWGSLLLMAACSGEEPSDAHVPWVHEASQMAMIRIYSNPELSSKPVTEWKVHVAWSGHNIPWSRQVQMDEQISSLCYLFMHPDSSQSSVTLFKVKILMHQQSVHSARVKWQCLSFAPLLSQMCKSTSFM